MYHIIFIFFLYSFMGWCLEVAQAAAQTESFVNRGFLNGPLCPVYGTGVVLMYLLLKPWEDHFLAVLFGAGIIGTVLEYFTAAIMEETTHIKWWDYKDLPFNFQGRICLFFSCLWGVGGMLCLEVDRIILERFWPETMMLWEKGILLFFCLVFLTDCTASVMTVLSLQNKVKKITAMAERIREVSRGIGNRIYEVIYSERKKKQRKLETVTVRKAYQKERKRRLLDILKKRMVMAAPGMAPDEEFLERLEKQQKRKKRRVFAGIMLNRVLWTGLLLLVQFIWLFIFLNDFAEMSKEISLGLTLLSLFISLYIVGKNENSAYKIGWIIIIMFLPLFGGLLYLLFGNKNPSRGLRQRLNRSHEKIKDMTKQDETVLDHLEQEHKRAAGRSRYIMHCTDYPVWQNTDTTYFPLGEDMFRDMIKELEQAEHYIFMEYFIIEEGIFWGTIREILRRKVKEGVDVRLIYDDMGCLMLLPKRYRKELEKDGIRCMAFNPFKPILSLVMNNRDHRKIMVIDGHTAYTGGINLADEYINVIDKYGHWKDTGIRLKGDAVRNFTMMFLEMWDALCRTEDHYEEYLPETWQTEQITGTGFVQPFGDTPLDDEAAAENIYIDIINEAADYVYIFTPYLIISDTMRHALCMAAGRGVDVRIVTPGIPDKKTVYRMTRSNYRDLLCAGVRIFEYTPGFLHAKCYVSDDRAAVVGSINMDYRSLYLHFECGVYLYETETVMDVKKDVLDTISRSKEVELIELRQGFLNRMIDAVLTVLSPLI